MPTYLEGIPLSFVMKNREVNVATTVSGGDQRPGQGQESAAGAVDSDNCPAAGTAAEACWRLILIPALNLPPPLMAVPVAVLCPCLLPLSNAADPRQWPLSLARVNHGSRHVTAKQPSPCHSDRASVASEWRNPFDSAVGLAQDKPVESLPENC